jgi:hypothetical protein
VVELGLGGGLGSNALQVGQAALSIYFFQLSSI